jgi:hypothetical protein
MSAVIITVEDLENFKSDLLSQLKEFVLTSPTIQRTEVKHEPIQTKWLKSYQVQRLLGISPGTLQNLRINGTLPYTKLGGTLLYNNEDIQKIINSNMRNNFGL